MKREPPPAGGEQPVASPCVSVCRLDAGGRICVGCWRTIDEIAAWGRLDDEERRRVLARIETRRNAAADEGS